MKNDIDSILESMFRGGRLHFKSTGDLKHARPAPPVPDKGQPPLEGALQAQQQAGQALGAVEQVNDGLSRSLQESIERLTQEAKADMEGLQRRLEQDGMDNQERAANSGSPADMDKAFDIARQETARQVLGQEKFIEALALAFKRPFVAGAGKESPLCRAAVLGGTGTGRHSAIKAMTASLGRQGVLKAPKPRRWTYQPTTPPAWKSFLCRICTRP